MTSAITMSASTGRQELERALAQGLQSSERHRVAFEPYVRGSVDQGRVRLEAGGPAQLSGVPAFFPGRVRFDGVIVGSDTEARLEGSFSVPMVPFVPMAFALLFALTVLTGSVSDLVTRRDAPSLALVAFSSLVLLALAATVRTASMLRRQDEALVRAFIEATRSESTSPEKTTVPRSHGAR